MLSVANKLLIDCF